MTAEAPTTFLQEQMQREARISGLRDVDSPSLGAVHRRRLQLWGVAIFSLLALSAAMAVVVLVPDLPDGAAWVTPQVLGVTSLVLILGVCLYVVHKERALRRLTSLLFDERVLTSALSNRVEELSALAAAARAINSVLDLEDVLDIILTNAMDLLRGSQASIMLLDGSTHLRVVCSKGSGPAPGTTVPLWESVAGRVARTGEPFLGPADPVLFAEVPGTAAPNGAMCVPLLNRGVLLGVLNVATGEDREYHEYDLRAANLFAEHAAVSIANARLYEAESRRVTELVEINRMKSDFIAAVSHELRTPLTSILGSVHTIRTIELREDQRDEFLEMIERQGNRLLRMIEEILTTAQLEGEGLAKMHVAPVDLAEVVRTVARDMSLSGGPIHVHAPEPCEVLGDQDLFQQVLFNLIDNADKHGAPPVRVQVHRSGEDVLLSVRDAGRGVPPSDRSRIFDRFVRLDPTGSRPGIGLGLAIVRQLVGACGGSVWVTEAPGGGADFQVTLPARVPAVVGV